MSADELADDEEYQDILDDVSEECGNYGKVETVAIPRPPNPAAGKIFVCFADKEQCLDAQARLDGRKFASNTVKALFYSKEAYDNKLFV